MNFTKAARSDHPGQKKHRRHYPRAGCSYKRTYYKKKFTFLPPFYPPFKADTVKIQLRLISQLAVTRHFGTDIEDRLFKIFVLGIVYLEYQFIHRFYQFAHSLFSTFADYKMYYRKYMLNYTRWILVFNRKVWKTAVFSTYAG